MFDSHHDFLAEFEKKAGEKPDYPESLENPDPKDQDCVSKNHHNRHGVSVLDDGPGRRKKTEDFYGQDFFNGKPANDDASEEIGKDTDTEDFALLLEESFKQKTAVSVKKKFPMPVKKRIKRYPPAEVELDLHGYTSIGAQVKTRSFIISSRERGYFTVRIIVGKGLHSDLGPVLPDVVEDVLKEMKKQHQVIWYEWDKKKKSTSGAVIVYLKHFEQFD